MAEGFKDFAPGDILTAADVDDYLMRQAVMRFADASARTTALSGVLVEGMMSYLKDTNTVEVYDGSAWVGVGGVGYGTATGGDSSATITVGGESYTMLTFLSSATLTVTDAGIFDFLIVGGGGGGGQNNGTYNGGGGGAGGYASETLYLDTNASVVVGAGGALATSGTLSHVGQFIGNFGGAAGSVSQPYEGQRGASGGGAMGTNVSGLYSGGLGDGVTGNDGGDNGLNSAGGGGGAGAAGANGTSSVGGAGGAGSDASAFRGEAATTTYYAGGGGGQSTTGGAGGVGGGGDGRSGTGGSADNGDANTGGGGGGGGGTGGSGIVLVRFKN